MQRFTYHTHNNSQGIFDGQNSCEEMVSKAESMGFLEIGVSNHYICHPNLDCKYPQDFNDFQKASEAAKRSIDEIREVSGKHKIKVLAGMEVDFFPSVLWQNKFEKLISEIKPDYLICSNHRLYPDDESFMCSLWFVDKFSLTKKEKNELIKKYWHRISLGIESGYFDFVAHIDLPYGLGVSKPELCLDEEEALIEFLACKNFPVEINTKSIFRCGEPSPNWGFIRRLVSKNIPLLISDDAHSAESLGYKFLEVEASLKELGCKNRFKL